MSRLLPLAMLAGLLLSAAEAAAHGVCGARIFPATLTVDDPAVADEVNVPLISWSRDGVQDGVGPTYNFDFDFSFAKRITPNFGVEVGYGFTAMFIEHGKRQFGWHDLEVTPKYAACVDAAHEFMLAVGVSREFGGTGTTHLGAAAFGSTTPTLYFGKGLGDLGADWLRPVALTGTFGLQVSDKGLKTLPDGGFNLGAENRWQGGLTLQYSLPYLQSQVRDVGLPAWMGRLTPALELIWSSPANRPSGVGTQYALAPAVYYNAGWYQLGLAMPIPLNRATGGNVGLMAQFHLFLDDLLPNSLGKPVFP
jgi:hypothetical protein